MVWVRERTIPTERPPLVGEVIANGSKRPYSRFSRQQPLLFYQVAPQLYSRGWVDPVPDPLLIFSGSAGNRTRVYGLGTRRADHEAPSVRKKLAITLPTSGGLSVGIVRSRTQTMEFFFSFRYQTGRQLSLNRLVQAFSEYANFVLLWKVY
jgi:hypothetical protein